MEMYGEKENKRDFCMRNKLVIFWIKKEKVNSEYQYKFISD